MSGPTPVKPGYTLAFERLRRLLFLVPWLAKHPGRPVAEVAEAVGVTKEALLEELDLLTFVGRPPFQPDDCIDVYVEDDRVYLELDQQLSRPPRLTAPEGVALAAAAALLKPPSGGALANALAKLEAVLPPPALLRYREASRQLDVASGANDTVTELTRAVVERRQVAFDYLPAGRSQPERRVARPLELLSHRGHWYLGAWDVEREATRLFRVDRVSELAVSDTPFEPPPGAKAATLPGRGEVERPVRVRFAPEVAAYQQERFGEAAARNPDGSLEVTVPGDSEAWLTRWILSFGGNATVLSPDWAIRAVAEAASASLQSR